MNTNSVVKKVAAVLFVILSASSSWATGQQNFGEILQKIENSTWKGQFKLGVLGMNCSGDLSVEFFPMQTEDFSNGINTLSYRHHADFSKTRGIICAQAAKFSPVEVGACEDSFPKKFSSLENALVPYRTIIPREDGAAAVMSSPSCNKQNQVKRDELNLAKAVLSPDGNQLTLTIQIKIAVLSVNIDYILNRQK